MYKEIDRPAIEKLIKKRRVTNFEWFDPREIVVSQWVRMKCQFGCPDYDKCLVCPPNLPSIPECRTFFNEYKHSVLIHVEIKVEDPLDRHKETRKVNARLLKLERDVFLMNFQKAFVVYVDPCNFCGTCEEAGGVCEHRKNARPSAEGLGVDVYSTVRKTDLPIQVLKEYSETMNRYGILLID